MRSLALASSCCLLACASLAGGPESADPAPQAEPGGHHQVIPPSVSRPIGPRPEKSETEWNPDDWGVGAYIWSAQTSDKQTCHLWHGFEIPRGAKVAKATLKVLADNGFVVLLDGRELGMGSDYYYMTEYDITRVLSPGKHAIAIRAFNESHQAGVVVGLRVKFKTGDPVVLLSDTTWRLVPNDERNWERRLNPSPGWKHAVEVARFGGRPWIDPPLRLNRQRVYPPAEPPLWKREWFQALVAVVGGAAAVVSLVLAARLVAESRARELLDRERARIARDIHDEMGAGLTQLILEGEVVRTELPADSAARDRLEAFCNRARSLAGAMDELVWAVNSRRDTLRDFVAFASKYIRRFLEPTSIRCRLEVASDLPDMACDLPVRRNLLLAVKEALNNAVKYSAARQLCFRVERRPPNLLVAVEDDGHGFDLETAKVTGNGLANLAQRMADIGGVCRITTAPGSGCRVELELPLARFVRRAGPPDRGADLLADGRRSTVPNHASAERASPEEVHAS